MKKTVYILLCVLTMMFLCPLTAYGDIGPKPSVVIHFNGLEGQRYYATLLSSVESTGPYSAVNSVSGGQRYDKEHKDYDIFLKFAEYQDKDGYYFLQIFDECTETHQFSWTYYPPRKFKILLYFPEIDRFIVSDTHYERYAFDSYFTAKISQTGISAEKSYGYSKEILSLIFRIILTIISELVLALLFGFREKKQFGFITIVNIITQIILNLTLNIINYHSGPLAFVTFYVLLEFVVFVTEAVLYSWYFRKYSTKKVPGWKPIEYALVANAASFFLGLKLASWIPGIF